MVDEQRDAGTGSAGQMSESPAPGQSPEAVGLPAAPARPRSGGRGALLLALIVAVGITGYVVRKGGSSQEDHPQIKNTLLCSDAGCAYTESRKLQLGESFPTKCPKCGKQTLYTSYACPKCSTMNILNQDKGIPDPSTCSKCGTELHYGE